ncbi:MAG: carotenoid 1,2-hydratase, partial [Candidatus Obscuribacterales bacterium]|nr:carotenoid 1,2-hydratase [Steroidobacteraceae bacterium]
MRILRALLVAVAVLAIGSVAAQSPADDSTVSPGYRIELARDGGSHPAFTTEWWYLTGWLQDAAGEQRGFQVTFFRSRNATADENPSAFAPRQILFAHAAVSDPIEKKLLRDEKIARAGFGLAETKQGATNVWIDNWSLRADGENLVTEVTAEDFSFSLQLQATQAVLLQGEQGYSRKDPDTASASYYYSLPQLDVAGSMTVRGSKVAVTGKAWFDHEWSNSYVNAQSAGWDWVGINLNESDALMVFRMRDLQGRQRWAGGTLRTNNKVQTFTAEQIKWTPLQTWRSPRTGVEYPVAWRVNVGEREFILRPLMNDQENDARGSVGILYWEG